MFWSGIHKQVNNPLKGMLQTTPSCKIGSAFSILWSQTYEHPSSLVSQARLFFPFFLRFRPNYSWGPREAWAGKRPTSLPQAYYTRATYRYRSAAQSQHPAPLRRLPLLKRLWKYQHFFGRSEAQLNHAQPTRSNLPSQSHGRQGWELERIHQLAIRQRARWSWDVVHLDQGINSCLKPKIARLPDGGKWQEHETETLTWINYVIVRAHT
jgi:hypothetical protein